MSLHHNNFLCMKGGVKPQNPVNPRGNVPWSPSELANEFPSVLPERKTLLGRSVHKDVLKVVLQPAKRTPPKTSRTKSSNTQRTENKTTDVLIQQHSRNPLKMDILMSETC